MLYWIVCLLAHSLSSVDARAVDTETSSLTALNIASSILADSGNGTAISQRCDDIDNCRTLNDIVRSCLVTIFACVWFAVHRNIPAPKRETIHHSNFFIKSAQWVWTTILDQKEPGIVCVVALLAPEWILAWALRQAIRAWKLTKRLEKAREAATEKWMEENGHSNTPGDVGGDVAAVATRNPTEIRTVPIHKRSLSGISAVQPDLSELFLDLN